MAKKKEEPKVVEAAPEVQAPAAKETNSCVAISMYKDKEGSYVIKLYELDWKTEEVLRSEELHKTKDLALAYEYAKIQTVKRGMLKPQH
jgi:hypothetical protein